MVLKKSNNQQPKYTPSIDVIVQLERGIRSPHTRQAISESDAYRMIREGQHEIKIGNLIEQELKASKCKSDRYGTLKQGLNSVLFGYSVNRSVKEGANRDIKHATNLINLDLDENDKETLLLARERIENGEFPFIKACGSSPSFSLLGSMWANVRVEVNTLDSVRHKELFNLMQLSEDSPSDLVFNTLQKKYVELIQEKLAVGLGVDFTQRSFKQPRFIVHDPNLYVAEESTLITLEQLAEYLRGLSKDDGHSFKVRATKRVSEPKNRNVLSDLVKNHNGLLNKAFPIKDIQTIVNNTLGWAERIGREFTPNKQGNRDENLMVQCSAMASFGVPKDEWLEYCLCNYVYPGDLKTSPFTSTEVTDKVNQEYTKALRDGTYNSASYVDYDAIQELTYYIESNDAEGIALIKGAYQVENIEEIIEFIKNNLLIPSTNFHLEKGQKLSDKITDIDKALQEHKKVELIAGTGVGKSYLCNKADLLPKAFCDRKGANARVVIVDSLNIKAKSDSDTYGNFAYTGQIVLDKNLNKDGHLSEGAYLRDGILNNKVLITNQMKLDTLMAEISHHLGADAPILLIVDEVQTLTKRYRENGIKKVMNVVENLNENSEVIFQTGTPKDYWYSQGFHRVRFTNDRGNINVQLRKRSAKFEADLLDLINEYPKEDNLLIVKINDKEAINRAFELFTDNEWLSSDEIVCIYSGNTKEQRAKYEKQLLNPESGKDSFDSKVHLVLCTSAINEGLDIYSNTRNAITINFEKRGIFEWDSLVQYLDRVRVGATTSKEALFYVRNADLKTKGFGGFIPKLEYERSLKDLIYIGKVSTTNSNNRNIASYSGHDFWMLRGRSVESGELLVWDYTEDKYIPNKVALICELEAEHNSRCTINEGFSYIERYFPYITFDKSTYIEESEINDAIMNKIEDAEERSKEAKEKAGRRFRTMLIIEPLLAIQSIIAAAPNDVKITSDFGKLSPLYYRKAKELVETSPDLYCGREFQYIQEIAKEYKTLTERFFLGGASAIKILFDEEGKLTKSKVKRFYDHASVQYEMFSKGLLEDAIGKSKSTSKQMQRINKELSVIGKLEIEKEYTRKELIKAVTDAARNKRDIRGLSEADALELVKRYCVVEKYLQTTRENRSRVMKITKLKDFSDFENEYEITEDDARTIKGFLSDGLLPTEDMDKD